MNYLTQQLKEQLIAIRNSILFEAVFVILVIISIALLLGEFVLPVSSTTIQAFGQINMAIAWIFLADFFLGLLITPDRRLYLKSDWFLLLASIPVSEYVFSSLRVFRLVRIFRIYGTISRSLAIPHLRFLFKRRRRH
ncbi:MAG: ion transporter [Candidatus Saccharimonadales bacterium]